MSLPQVDLDTAVNPSWGNSVVDAINAIETITDALSAELQNLTDAEVQQLLNIDSVTISNGQWAVVGGMAGTLTATEVNFLDGVTSAIQTQLDSKINKDGTTELTGSWDAGSFSITAETLVSDVATGTAPFTVSSTTVVSNLNADQVDGFDMDQAVLTSSSPTFVLTTSGILQKGNGVFDVKAYGATGDGSTDDQANIDTAHTAATASGGILYFPGGSNSTYRFSTNQTFNSDVTVMFADGAKLAIDTGVTVAISGRLVAGLHQIFALTGTGLATLAVGSCEYVIPEWWGALGDDSTDNTAAIEAAITAAANVKHVKLPPGIYRITTPIDNWPYNFTSITTAGMTFAGSGPNATTIKYTGTDDYALKFDNPALESEASSKSISRLVVKDLNIDAASITGSAIDVGGAILLAGTSICRFENVHVGNVGDGTVGTAVSARRRHYVQTEDSFSGAYDTLRDFTSAGGSASTKYAVQFTTPASFASTLKEVVARVGKTGAPAGTMTASLYSDAAGVPDAIIATASNTITLTALTTTPGADETFSFDWDSDRDLAASTAYWIVFETSGYTYTDGVTEVWFNVDAGGAGGSVFGTFDDGGGGWSAAADGTDYIITSGRSHVWINVFEGLHVYGGNQRPARVFHIRDDSQIQISNSNMYGVEGINADGTYTLWISHTEVTSAATGSSLYVVGGQTYINGSWFEGGNGSDFPVYFDGGKRHSIYQSHFASAIDWSDGTDVVFDRNYKTLLGSDDGSYVFGDKARIYVPGSNEVTAITGTATTVADAFALNSIAWEFDANNEGIRLSWTADGPDMFPRGTYLVSVVAKDTNQVADDFEVQSQFVNNSGSGKRLSQNWYTLTSEYDTYHFLHVIGKDHMTQRGSRLNVQKTTAGANTINVSHVIVEYLGTDDVRKDLIASSSVQDNTDGARASSVVFRSSRYEDEILSETDFATHANWATVGDFDDTGGNAAYTHAGGSGTLTQASGGFANAANSNRPYRFKYIASGVTGSPVVTITTAFAALTETLTISNGTHEHNFTSKNGPGDFVISATSSAGEAFTLDDVSLMETGLQSDLASITASHDGAAVDDKGKIGISVNDGNDGFAPTDRLVIDSAGKIHLIGDVVSETYNFAADAEASDTYAITLDPAPTAYTTGLMVTFTANTVNTGACTLNVNGLGAKSLKVMHDQDPSNGYIESGSAIVAIYDGTNFQILNHNAGASATPNYAGITVDGNAVATTILLVDAYEPVTIFDSDMPEAVSNGAHGTDNITIGATGIYELHFNNSASGAAASKVFEMDGFEIAAAGDAVSGATQATPCVITATGHSFNNGDRVKIAGVGGMTELNGHIYTVTNKGANDFELEDDNGADIASGGYGAYSGPGTAYLATKLSAAHSHRSFGGIGVVGNMGNSGLVSLTSGNTLEAHVKNTSDANNLTIESSSLWIKQI